MLIDYNVLPRVTNQGHRVILAIIDTSSGYCYYEPLPDSTVLTTVKAFVHRVLPHELMLRSIISAKEPSFIGKIFKIITQKVLGLTIWSSSFHQVQNRGISHWTT